MPPRGVDRRRDGGVEAGQAVDVAHDVVERVGVGEHNVVVGGDAARRRHRDAQRAAIAGAQLRRGRHGERAGARHAGDDVGELRAGAGDRGRGRRAGDRIGGERRRIEQLRARNVGIRIRASSG